ncbi:MAG: tRNA 2-thiouridine(34) synthase MnmA [Sphingobacteriales bacterium]|jgi:tRNA-specific 2-thiouridylase|nr:tRNA 2-thiouridine(34) synthase MnmA [Sphingobacteriales bacterium]MBP9142560.1 tRNA 2-thiouridine(34) synthase MnmA [Chitinophagales bacterium]MDA0199543.1 tRNA 2-thiouridine(34) synthase MnmA [Bacteroidota bacterium]MBK6890493.1 tRNA 2-thiouridine(34) synthase MnmA [Sphingobacteriales bacterium]MBK7526456.1 tRNA 2-thiouridine(34) synthase MnmA [Sphingobacteriales bacterium]
MSKNGRVLVAMSGGIDSTVTAAMLHQQGYEVVGITMKTWDYATAGGSKKETGCCSLDSINDARQVAVDMGFHHFIIDIREEFGDWVIDNFVQEYLAGRTPNPCILCNTHIKWAALLRRANSLNCEFIATGHYAQLRKHTNGRFVVSRGLDTHKDQSYVLWGLPQESLARTMFPVGNYHKSQIRQMARDWGYENLAQKAESYEICFIPDNDYRGFLKRRVNGLTEQVAGGNFVNRQGKILGQHQGYPFYTIGQRKGLGLAFGTPMYVAQIIPHTNTVVLGEWNEMQRNGMTVYNVNMMKYQSLPNDGMHLNGQIRAHHQAAPCWVNQFYTENATLNENENNQQQKQPEQLHLNCLFDVQVDAITPGQSAVFYEDNDVVCGGHIQNSFDVSE